jgi:hypothetical protein
MIVRIRFGRGRVVTRRKGTNGRAALLLASLLTLVTISCGALGLWRLCQDLDLAGDFVFSSGFLSHWQVWIAATAASQYAAWRLTRYSKISRLADSETDRDETSSDKIAARV